MPRRDSASVQVRASAIWPTAAAAWLSSSSSRPGGNLSTVRPSAMAPEDTTSRSRLPPCSTARSAISDSSQASLSLPACASTSREEPTLTTIRRKSASRGVSMLVFMAGVVAGLAGRPKRDKERQPPRSARGAGLEFGLVPQLLFVFQAIIARQPAYELTAFPIVENTADIFARDAGHGGEVALADLLADDDAAGADILAEILGQFEKCTGDPAAQRQEASSGDHRVGFAQARGQQRHQRFVDFGVLFGEIVEGRAAQKRQRRTAHRHDRCRARQTVDDRQFADDRARAEEGEDALGAGARHHRDLEQPVFDAIAAVARVAGEE